MAFKEQRFQKFALTERERQHKLVDSDDKQLGEIILRTSTGAFGVSLTLVTGFVKATNSISLALITLAWLSLAVCIYHHTRAYYLSKNKHQNAFNWLNDKVKSTDKESEKHDSNIYTLFMEEQDKLNKPIKNADKIAFNSFVCGIIFLVFFGILTIWQVHTVKDDSDRKSKQLELIELKTQLKSLELQKQML